MNLKVVDDIRGKIRCLAFILHVDRPLMRYDENGSAIFANFCEVLYPRFVGLFFTGTQND